MLDRSLLFSLRSCLPALLLLIAGCGGSGSLPPEGDPEALLVEGATLVDGTGAPPRENVSILIEGGRLSQIGPAGSLRAPAGARVVDARDKYVIPGLIDSHVHYDMPWLHRLYLANGVTAVRDLGGEVGRLTTLRQEINVGNILAPRLFISGQAINPFSARASQADSLKAMAQAMVEAGVDGIKVTGYTAPELEEMVEVAHANGLLVYGHTGPKRGDRAPGASAAIRAGLDGIEHALGVLEDSMGRPVQVPDGYDPLNRDHIFRYWYGRMHSVVDPQEMNALILRMVENDVYFAPTLVNFESNFALRGTDASASNPNLQYIPEDEPDPFGPFGNEEREEWNKTLRLMKEAAYAFQKAGGLLVAGTDSPGAALPGWSLHRELELFVEAGLTPAEALRTATANNAAILNRADELGTVEVGKRADLLLLDADPLASISNTRRVHRVILGGRVLDPAELLQANLRQFGRRGERNFDRKNR